MSKDIPSQDAPKANAVRNLTPAAERALAEAEARRAAGARDRAAQPPQVKEVQGRQGPDPARYGDWENKGIASDF